MAKSIEQNDKKFLRKEQEINLTETERTLIRSINSTFKTLNKVRPQGWDINESKIRAKEKDYETILRIEKMFDKNIKNMKAIILSTGINSTIAEAKNKDSVRLNTLQLYELWHLLNDNMVDKNNANYRTILKNASDKIIEALTWDSFGNVKDMYNLIELGLYRQVILKIDDTEDDKKNKNILNNNNQTENQI